MSNLVFQTLPDLKQEVNRIITKLAQSNKFFEKPATAKAYQTIELLVSRAANNSVDIVINKGKVTCAEQKYLTRTIKSSSCKLFFLLDKIFALSNIIGLKILGQLNLIIEINDMGTLQIASVQEPFELKFATANGCLQKIKRKRIAYQRILKALNLFSQPRQIIAVIRKDTTPITKIDSAYDAFLDDSGCECYYSTRMTLDLLLGHMEDKTFCCILLIDQDHALCAQLLGKTQIANTTILPSRPERLEIDLMKCVTLASYTNPKVYAEVKHEEWQRIA